MKHYLLSTVGVLLCTLTALTQPDDAANLKSGILSPEAFLPARNFGEQQHSQARSGNYTVLLLHFETLPVTFEQQNPVYTAGVLLDHYIPENTWLARVPDNVDLQSIGVDYYYPFLPEFKLSAALTYAPATESEDGMLRLMVYPYPSESVESLYQSLLNEGYPEVQLAAQGVLVQVSLSGVAGLSTNPDIMYIESAPKTPLPESIPARSLHRANFINQIAGQNIDGTGVGIALGDDGPVSHEDFRGRNTQYTSTNLGNHGDMVAGIMCGAGNIDPVAVGAAPGANLFVYPIDGYAHIEQAPQNFTANGTVITVTSYSESSGGEYSYSASNLDGQAIEHPYLLHVFSAGNNAGDPASPVYLTIMGPDGAFYANITGGRKASKSAIAVGNVYDYDEIRFSSSRGPAGDGRIKPDICSNGQGQLSTNANNTYQFGGGTSAAAPGVGGSLALLVQLYRFLHNGMTPDGGLIKATILNGAEDLGRTGPDYTYGWGRLNVARAARTLQNNQHFTGVIAHGAQQNHTITIPPNTKQVRVMTYWSDVPGAPMAGKALVNDLDTRLIAPGNQTHFPWALSAYPHPDSLSRPAWHGSDHLNNMEQVVIDNPVAGTYTLRVNGYLIPQGPQEYHVVYCFITKDLEITYPVGGEGFVPGENQIIRWDATSAGQSGSFSLSYSTDNMATWTPIAANIAPNLRQYAWTTPNVVSGKVFIRVSRGTQSSTSPAPFTIIGQPNFQIQYASANAAAISWPAVPGATSYTVYTLGEKYMTPIGTTNSTSFNASIAPWESKWFSVSANNNQGATGRRAYAKKYLHTPCDVWVNINLQFDLYPGETRWEIVNNSGMVVASGGPYSGQAPNSTLNIQQCLPSGCYELVMYDSYGDGMCCNRGNGSFQITNTSGNILVSGGQFNSAQVSPFCISGAATPLTIQLVALQAVRCKGGQDGWISVQASGGTGNYNYLWNTGTSGQNLSNIPAGTYTVIVTDGLNQAQLSVMISEPAMPFVVSLVSTPNNCGTGAPTGSISRTMSGGTAPYTYQWSNGANTASLTGLPAGNYSLTVTDANGCIAVASATVTESQPATISLSSVPANCFGSETGAINSTVTGGTPPYSYLWSNDAVSANISGLEAGNYSLTVTDGNGCIANATATVAQSSLLNLQLFPEDISCYGETDGQIFMMISGGTLPYHYAWSNGSTSGWLENLPPGAYSLTVTDGQGCQIIKSAGVQQPQPLAPNALVTHATNGSNGAVHLEVTGGTAPYSYLWSTGATTQHVSGLSAGTYSVLVTDVNNCIGSTSAIITNQVPSLSYCVARGSNTNFEWIKRVQIGNFINQSGNNGGYAYFDAPPAPIQLIAGAQYAIILTPDFQNNPFNESWRIWLDLNHDGDFLDSGELLFAPGLSNQAISANLQIPSGASPGFTRMRIAMKYGSAAATCGVFAYGEVEDYAVIISESNDNLSIQQQELVPAQPAANQPWPEPSQEADELDLNWSTTVTAQEPELEVFPNPAGSFVNCRFESPVEGNAQLSIFDMNGKLLKTQETLLYIGGNHWKLDLNGIPKGTYLVRLVCLSHTYEKRLIATGP